MQKIRYNLPNTVRKITYGTSQEQIFFAIQQNLAYATMHFLGMTPLRTPFY